MTVYLSIEDLLTLIEDLGVGPVRDVGLLDAAAHRPRTTVFGQEAYPTLEGKASALLQSLVANHALMDGNKRLGWLALVVFYGLNGVDLDVPDDQAYDMVIAVAEGKLDRQAAELMLASWRQQC